MKKIKKLYIRRKRYLILLNGSNEKCELTTGDKKYIRSMELTYDKYDIFWHIKALKWEIKELRKKVRAKKRLFLFFLYAKNSSPIVEIKCLIKGGFKDD